MTTKVLSYCGVLAWILLGCFCGIAAAQGCNQQPIDEGDVECCDNTYKQPNTHCGPGGSQDDFVTRDTASAAAFNMIAPT